MPAHIFLEIVFIRVFERGIRLLCVKQLAQSYYVGMPLRQQLIQRAALSYLIFYLSDFGVPIPFHRFVPERLEFAAVAEVYFLYKIAAVEQIVGAPFFALCEKRFVIFGSSVFAHRARHIRSRLQRAEIKSFQPARRSKKFHVERVMLTPFQHSVAVIIPAVRVFGAPHEFERFLYSGPYAGKPLIVAGKLPFAPYLYNAAQLTVHAGTESAYSAAERNTRTEHHSAVRALVVRIIVFSYSAFERREQKRQRVRIIPDVRAGTLARTFLFSQTFPAVKVAFFAYSYRSFGF